jgi:uncharacterized protein (TIGR02145 family)
MKKSLFFLMILCTINANAQNYLISFAGTGSSTSVESVKVENLTSGTSLIMNGTDVLHLMAITTGIKPINDNQSSKLKIFPNPMSASSVVQIYPEMEGRAVITVTDINGNILARRESFLINGLQEFRVAGLKNGLFIVTVRGNGYSYSEKLLSNFTSDGTIVIEKIRNSESVENIPVKNKDSKGIQGTVDMSYTTGDRIKFTGISGNYSTVKIDIPAGDKTITFDFMPCTDGDNISYPVVQIGTQTWMAENLKTTKYRNNDLIGTTIPSTLNIYNEVTPKYQWAYDGNENNVATYGRLYTWDLVTDNRNICPTAWHVPSASEWSVMINYLGGPTYSGAGAKLIETGSLHWAMTFFYPGTNESGFSALPAGCRLATDPSFYAIQGDSYWWTTNGNGINAKATNLDCNGMIVTIAYQDKASGFSIRCLKGEGFVLPALNTTEVTSVDQKTAISGGNIVSDGGATITARGVCWSLNPNPVSTGSHTTNGTGIGVFVSSISGLAANTTYYLRAYASNTAGTSYGNEIIFKTNPQILPTLSTTVAFLITSTTAKCGGHITDDGGSTINIHGVCWNTSPHPEITNYFSTEGAETETYLCSMTGLTPNTTYYVRAFATNSVGTMYGNEISFSTKKETDIVLSDIDGNTYATVQIGTQTWMAENLKTTRYRNGDLIGTTSSDIRSENTPKYQWAYNGNVENVNTYGRLYTWYSVTDTRNVCPVGSHIPTNDEWTILIDYLINNGYGYLGSGDDIAKSFAASWGWTINSVEGNTGTNQWNNNSSGFTALPAGCRAIDGSFAALGFDATWWSSTTMSAKQSGYCGLPYNSSTIGVSSCDNVFGNSVRCIQEE